MTLENTDIHKIIDDAMEKKDRTVMIFISDAGTSVNVNPIDNHKPHWVIHRNENHRHGLRGWVFECSECGAIHDELRPYCSICGEKLAIPREDKNGRN